MTPKLYNNSPVKQKYQVLLRDLKDFSLERARPVIYHLYDKGYSYQDVADIYGTSRQLIEQDFPQKTQQEAK